MHSSLPIAQIKRRYMTKYSTFILTVQASFLTFLNIQFVSTLTNLIDHLDFLPSFKGEQND